MPEYLAPGVYVEEISTGPVPIAGVSTSTTGFVGQTERGPTAPQLVTSWIEYQRWYGTHLDTAVSFLPFAVQGFFDNGGQRLFVARVVPPNSGAATFDLATGTPGQELRLSAIGPGSWGQRLFARVMNASPPQDPAETFRLTLLYYEVEPQPFVDPLDPNNITNPDRREPDVVEDYEVLGFDPVGAGFVITSINGSSRLVQAEWTDPDVAPARPNDVGFAAGQFQGGDDGGGFGTITANEFRGDGTLPVNARTGLAGLEAIDEIALLAVPDEVHPNLDNANSAAVTNELVNQCERLKDRFAILQVAQGQGNVTTIPQPRDSSYSAIYYPWVRVFDPRTLDTVLVPPGGHVAGIYARTDTERGVHKAPANAEVRGIMTRDLSGNRWPLEYKVTKGQHDVLNPRGINVIRDFRADRRGIRVWGARTTSSDTQWRYVNVRRLFIFVEESIDEGTQWVVFEPNDEPTWARVRRSVSNFLTRVWRDGALMGATPEEAYFVRCDLTTMTQDDIDNGRLIAYIGIAPVKPAEFVIFRISQKTIEATA